MWALFYFELIDLKWIRTLYTKFRTIKPFARERVLDLSVIIFYRCNVNTVFICPLEFN